MDKSVLSYLVNTVSFISPETIGEYGTMAVEDTTTRSIARQTSLSESALATIENVMEDALEEADRPSEAVEETFSWAVGQYPTVNMADIWNYGVNRAYIRLFNGSEQAAHQSWRNVGGTAFEHFVVNYYSDLLPGYLRIEHITNTDVRDTIDQVTDEDAENIVDAVLLGRHNGDWIAFAGIQTITSLKGRLQNYVEASQQLQEAGLSSYVMTLDSHVPESSVSSSGEIQSEVRTEAAAFVEERGCFDFLFSFNEQTVETQFDNTEGEVRVIGDTRLSDAFIIQTGEDWSEFVQPLYSAQSLRVE